MRRLFLLFAAVAVLFAAIICFSPLQGQLDAPLAIISTQRILHGEMPYRDFQALYGPLAHLVSAALQYPFRALEPTTSANLLNFLCSLSFFLLSLTVLARCRPSTPLGVAVNLTVLVFVSRFLATFSSYSLLSFLPVLLASILAPFAFLDLPGSRRLPLLLGACIAAALFMRFNFGIYLAASIALTGMLALFARRRHTSLAVLYALITAAALATLLALVFDLSHSLRPLLADMAVYVPRAAASRHISLAAIWTDPTMRPFLVSFLVMAAVPLVRLPGRILRGRVDGSLVGGLLLAAFTSYGVFRFDEEHVYPGLLLCILLLAGQAPPSASRSSLLRSLLRTKKGLLYTAQALSVICCITAVNLRIPGSLRFALSYWRQADDGKHAVRHNVALSPGAVDLLNNLDLLRKPSEELYIGGAQGSCQSTYDMCANLALYLAAGTLPRQRIWFFDTASTVFPEVQREIVAGLEQKQTPWIILQTTRHPGGPPTAVPEDGTFTRYVRTHYQPRYTSQDTLHQVDSVIYARGPG